MRKGAVLKGKDRPNAKLSLSLKSACVPKW